MIHYINGCQDCPMLNYDGDGYGACMHPKSKKELKNFSKFKDDSVQTECPLRTVDLILTIR